MALEPETDIRYLKGVGEQRARLYGKLGVATVEELLYLLPRHYLDFTAPQTIASAPVGERAAIRATVLKKSGEQRIRRGLSLFKVLVGDDDLTLEITFFNARYTVQSLTVGQEYYFYGKVGGSLFRRKMDSPQVYPLSAGGTLLPVYPLTAGLSSRMVTRQVEEALSSVPLWEDPLAGSGLAERYDLPPYAEALRMVHHPHSWAEVERGRSRLVFEELLCLALSFARLREGRAALRVRPMEKKPMEAFYRALPFTLTGAQQRAIDETLRDLCSGIPMNRLIQGDVGSGKTMVAAAAAYFAAQNGVQSALMAPTEILAQQHYKTLEPLLSGLGMRVALLTGSVPLKEKRVIKEALAAGELDLCIGTHALLTGDTVFGRLGLVITDEQHRFGVGQRAALQEKGEHTNVLVMSATPIPRTLAMIIYGDLELSVMDELPAGRRTIRTYLIDSSIRERAFGFVKKHLDEGYQAYLVCPAVEEDEEGDPTLKAATAYAAELAAGAFRNYRVGLLHGQQKPSEKERVMAEFAAGEIQLLVATTVIEVGVDVPNAVLMVVENAERFGLSQLHQLRGRVGRGSVQSHCILISDTKNEETRNRLRTLTAVTDGFKIAEEDLKLRGPGDFFGSRQHGLPELKVADLAADTRLLQKSEEAAELLLTRDPELESVPALRRRCESMYRKMSL